MPLPDRLARFNRRITNPVMRTYAGRVPSLAIVEHTGRRSGRTYHTPVNAFRTDDGFAIALTYGPDRDWVKNVQAAGGCALQRLGRRVELTDPRMVEGTGLVPAPVRVVLRLLRVGSVLRLRAARPD